MSEAAETGDFFIEEVERLVCRINRFLFVDFMDENDLMVLEKVMVPLLSNEGRVAALLGPERRAAVVRAMSEFSRRGSVVRPTDAAKRKRLDYISKSFAESVASFTESKRKEGMDPRVFAAEYPEYASALFFMRASDEMFPGGAARSFAEQAVDEKLRSSPDCRNKVEEILSGYRKANERPRVF